MKRRKGKQKKAESEPWVRPGWALGDAVSICACMCRCSPCSWGKCASHPWGHQSDMGSSSSLDHSCKPRGEKKQRVIYRPSRDGSNQHRPFMMMLHSHFRPKQSSYASSSTTVGPSGKALTLTEIIGTWISIIIWLIWGSEDDLSWQCYWG